MRSKSLVVALATGGLFASAATAGVTTVDFSLDDNGLAIVNGQDISSDEYFADFTISTSGSNDGAAAFDSNPAGPNSGAEDIDLLVNLGNVLILQELGSTQTTPGIFDSPDDEANGGVITFDFNAAVGLCSIDLIDIDSGAATTVTLTDINGLTRVYEVPDNWTNEVNINPVGFQTLDLTTLADQLGEGGATATASEDAGFDASSVLSLDIDFSGSGALDNLTFVPAPGSAALLALGGMAMTRRRR